LPHDARLTICGAGKTPNLDVTGSRNLTIASGGRPQLGQRRRFSLSVTTATESSNEPMYETLLKCFGISIGWFCVACCVHVIACDRALPGRDILCNQSTIKT
jgi:hypothetical protein